MIAQIGRRIAGLGMGRRTGGVRAFNPADYGTVALWLKADALELEDEDPVDVWPNSGAGVDGTQATFVKIPTYHAGIINGLPVVRFDGVDDSLNLTTDSTEYFGGGGTEVTIIAVISTHPTHPNTLLASGDAAVGARFTIHPPYADSITYFDVGGDGLGRLSGALTWETPSIGVFRRSGADMQIAKNGETILSTSTAGYAVTTGSPVFLGVFLGADAYLEGDVAEILVFPSALSSEAQRSVEQYLAEKYGITLS